MATEVSAFPVCNECLPDQKLSIVDEFFFNRSDIPVDQEVGDWPIPPEAEAIEYGKKNIQYLYSLSNVRNNFNQSPDFWYLKLNDSGSGDVLVSYDKDGQTTSGACQSSDELYEKDTVNETSYKSTQNDIVADWTVGLSDGQGGTTEENECLITQTFTRWDINGTIIQFSETKTISSSSVESVLSTYFPTNNTDESWLNDNTSHNYTYGTSFSVSEFSYNQVFDESRSNIYTVLNAKDWRVGVYTVAELESKAGDTDFWQGTYQFTELLKDDGGVESVIDVDKTGAGTPIPANYNTLSDAAKKTLIDSWFTAWDTTGDPDILMKGVIRSQSYHNAPWNYPP